jgi:hypothetical protein
MSNTARMSNKRRLRHERNLLLLAARHRYSDASSRISSVVLLLILIDLAASAYQLLNLSLADLFFDKPFAIAALASFELGASDPDVLDKCFLPLIDPI